MTESQQSDNYSETIRIKPLAAKKVNRVIYRYLLECLVIKITYLPPISF